MQLNGTTQYVTFGAAAALGASTFTLETWFRRTGAGVGTSTGNGGIASAIPLITKGRAEAEASNVDMNYFLGIDSATNRLVVDFEEGAAGSSPGLNHPFSGTTAVTSNVWHHAAATYDGTSWRIYLDGALDGTLSVGQPPRADSIQHAALGTAMTSTGAAAGFFQGAIDEARIWNVARSGAQILADRDHTLVAGYGPDRPLRPQRGHRHDHRLERRRRAQRHAHGRRNVDGRPAAHARRHQHRAGRRLGHDHAGLADDEPDADGERHEP